MSHCEVVELRNSADAVGYSCSRTASTQCSGCGSELCESHAETCGACSSIFPSCFFFHRAPHSKPAARGTSRAKKGLKPTELRLRGCSGLFPVSERHKLIQNFLQSFDSL